MFQGPQVLTTLSGFVRTLLSPYDVDAVLQDLTSRLRQVLDLTGAGVSLASDGELHVATAIPMAIVELERQEDRAQEGPCASAFRSGEIVVVPDTHASWAVEKWPRYCAVAHQIGIISVVGVPMTINGQAIGAINLYSDTRRDWSQDELAGASVFADAATVYLTNASTYDKQRLLNEQLQQALDSRVLIEQAKGIIAEADGTDVDAAFQIIRHHARSHNASLRAVAHAIVSLGLGL